MEQGCPDADLLSRVSLILVARRLGIHLADVAEIVATLPIGRRDKADRGPPARHAASRGYFMMRCAVAHLRQGEREQFEQTAFSIIAAEQVPAIFGADA